MRKAHVTTVAAEMAEAVGQMRQGARQETAGKGAPDQQRRNTIHFYFPRDLPLQSPALALRSVRIASLA